MNMIDLKEIKKQKEMEENQGSLNTQEEQKDQETQYKKLEKPPQKKDSKPRRKKLKTFVKLAVCFGVIFVVAGTVLSSNSIVEKSGNFFSNVSMIGQIRHLVESSDRKLKGEEDDRINILLLGIDKGADLSDTIMIASIKPSVPDVALISVPRDLTVPFEGHGRPKVNAIHAYAERQEEGSGGEVAAEVLGDIFDIPIHYYARANFEGFENIIDIMGGIDIYVEETLEDHRYPIKGREDHEDYYSRFEHLYIEEGWHHMDGEIALKYVRSRHAQGAQGSDFARARRQQQVLSAIKENFDSTNILLKPSLIMDVMNELGSSVKTNMEVWEMIRLWNIGKEVDAGNIKREVLEPGPQGLVNSYYSTSTGYILLPRDNSFREIQYMIENIFDDKDSTESQKTKVEDVTLEIRNGTWITGLAARTSTGLKEEGFDVVQIGNSEKKDFQNSVIYDLSFGSKPEALEILKQKTGANISTNIPDWLREAIREDVENESVYEKPDFLLILGESASDKF